ncbi:MAG: MgtC/SapB family protein [Anaerolineales bacterium]
MDLATQLDPWWRFGAAMLIGALIGLEREYIQQRGGEPEFAGIRTFSLLALLGAVAAYLSLEFGIIVFLVAYVLIGVMIAGSLAAEILSRDRGEGITTEVVGLLVPFLGALVIFDYAELAAALSVVAALVLALKPALHGLASRMSYTDLWATLQFALITAVVLPMLPNESFGPYDAFNLREVWLMVVLVSGISFIGYILMKLWGTKRGVGVTGLLGGLASSTAVTVSLSNRSRDVPTLSRSFALGIILASCVLVPRVLVEVAAVEARLLPLVLPPLLAMLAAGGIGAFLLWRRSRLDAQEERETELKNPLELSAALTFALAFGFVILLVRAANAFFGEAGVFAASLITGLVDVDAITLSSAKLVAGGQLEMRVGAQAILIAAIMNTISKAAITLVVGAPALRKEILRVLGAMVVTAIAVAIIFL